MLENEELCWGCNGTGLEPYHDHEVCSVCHGQGVTIPTTLEDIPESEGDEIDDDD